MGRKNSQSEFAESALRNNNKYIQYYDRLTELSIAMFEWQNLPDTVDERFLEYTLFNDGQAVFFKDDVIGYLGLQVATAGGFNVYRVPLRRRAYAVNGYNANLTIDNSIIIYNNMLRKNSRRDVTTFAMELAEIDRVIDVNVRAQKTPILIKCPENQRLTFKNLYMQYDGNSPVIYGDKGLDTVNQFTVLNTEAPYIADKLYTLKTHKWNEALTYLGISNTNIQKKERLISDEVARNMGGIIASRYSRLNARRQACEQINKMFGLNVWCDFREDYRETDDEFMLTGDTGNEEVQRMVTDLRTRSAYGEGGTNE